MQNIKETQNEGQDNLVITVSTVEGKPTFTVPKDTSAAVVRKMVADRFGYQEPGVAHCWSGNIAEQ